MPAPAETRRRVLHASPFIPPEFIAAHGLQAVRVAATAPTACHQGRCAAAAGFDAAMATAGPGDLAIAVTSCDQLRRGGEDAAIPVFRFDLPATWESATAAAIYRGELQRLSRFLLRHGASAPDDAVLADAILDHDRRRARLRSGCALLPARAAAELLADYAGSGAVPGADPQPAATDHRPGIALLGGPLTRQGFALYDRIEAAGASVALDGCETGERSLPAAVDRRQVRDDPLGELTAAYFHAIPDVFRRPDQMLYAWLERHIEERRLRAVVVHGDPWCDLWRGFFPRLKAWGRLPAILLEPAEGPGGQARQDTRLQALVEMLA